MKSTSNVDLIVEYMRYIQGERNLSEHTVSAYRRDLFQYAEVLELAGNTIFGAGYDDYSVFVQHLADHGVQARSRSRKIAAVRGMYKWLIRNERLEKDPTARSVLPKLPKLLPNPVPQKAMADILERTGKRASADDATPIEIRNHAMLEVLYSAGLRVGELCGLRQSALALDAGTARVRGKGNKERIVMLGESSISATRNYLQFARQHLVKPAKGHQRALFLSERGTQITPRRVQQIVDMAGGALDANEHIHPHRIRHSCATDMLRGKNGKGADLRAVQELMGHANLNTTQGYTQLVKDQLQDAHARFHPRG